MLMRCAPLGFVLLLLDSAAAFLAPCPSTTPRGCSVALDRGRPVPLMGLARRSPLGILSLKAQGEETEVDGMVEIEQKLFGLKPQEEDEEKEDASQESAGKSRAKEDGSPGRETPHPKPWTLHP